VFVIDSTSNLLEKDFQLYILGTIAEIIQHLDVDSGRTRVAAVYFTDTPKVHNLIYRTLFTLVAATLWSLHVLQLVCCVYLCVFA